MRRNRARLGPTLDSSIARVLVAVACWALSAPGAAAQDGVESDRAALEALYDATGGAGWTESTNWKTPAPLGEWHGVRTDTAGRVTSLDLNDNGLAGPIPDALGSLAGLQHLRLSWNDLTGPIPGGLGNLTELRSLYLSGNALTGPIPGALASLGNLEWLYLNWNALTGPVPAWLGNLARLRGLVLARAGLTGPLPEAVGRLQDLEVLRLDENALTGPVPAWLGNLARLRRLWLFDAGLTGPLPEALGRLQDLEELRLDRNALTGPVPAWLGNLARLRWLGLSYTDLTGPLPEALGRLQDLEELRLSYAWGVTGSLPPSLETTGLRKLDIFATQACAPAAWRERPETEFAGRVCGAETHVTVDLAVVYTPAAREAVGGRAAIEAAIDLMVAETNAAYLASGVHHRLALVGRDEVQYVESGDLSTDLHRLREPSDGHMDEVHAWRDRVGADLVHLVFDAASGPIGGIASRPGAFSTSSHEQGGRTLAHELGHNMGLLHDRYQVHHGEGGVFPHPAYGYVNQQAFEAGGEPSRWISIMAYSTQCSDAGFSCWGLDRFSNPDHRHDGDPLGVAFGAGASGVTGPSDAVAVLNATASVVAAWRDPPGANRRPVAVGTLPDRTLVVGRRLELDVLQAFDDPDDDSLTYAALSSAPDVVTVLAAGARVTLTAISTGVAAIRVTAIDPDGRSASQRFTVTVRPPTPFTDDPIVPGVTPVRAVHFTELRTRIDVLRREARLASFRWTDPELRPGVTRVRRVHLLELRSALAAVYAAAGRVAPRWADASPAAGSTPIRAVHLMELRAAVLALE